MILASADRAACRALLAGGSRSFFAASHLLPKKVREPATALYAFCRLADDAVDLDPGSSAGRAAALVRLRERLDAAYRGAPREHPADRAFAATVEKFAIPKKIPEALLEGLQWDAESRRYETLDDLHAYAARVAGTVGVMMALVMGVRDRAALARACDLGAAMQLTNIARDIGEDSSARRLYLPQAWMREEGLDPDAWLAAPSFSPAIARLTRRLLAEADRLYRLGEAGIAALPFACRPGIRAARLLYAEIGHEVLRAGGDSVTRRAVVPMGRKLGLLARAAVPGWGTRQERGAPPLLAVRFLLEAVEPVTAPQQMLSLADQMLWVLDLFERIDRRQIGSGL